MIDRGAYDWSNGLFYACYSGNLQIVELMISKGANRWNVGFYGACRGGRLQLVELMIEKGANDWNSGLFNACVGDHLHIVKFMIEKGASNLYKLSINQAYKILEDGVCIRHFITHNFSKLLEEIEMFRKAIKNVHHNILISDLLNLVPEYSLK